MLWLWNFFIERKQLTYVLVTVLVIAGTYSIFQIPKENSPSIDIPEGIVTTILPGASAEDMETLVTNKLESQISGINNIDTVTSNSGDGLSQIIVQFTANANTNQSIQDLKDAVSRATPNLPSDVITPQVTKINFSNQPILVVSISGDLLPIEFSDLGQKISDDLLNVTGISQVVVSGVPKREVDVIVRKESLEQYGLRITDVISAIIASNSASPAGKISIDGVNYNVNFKGGITDPEQIKDIAVSTKNNVPVYLRDIADISNGLAPVSTYSRVSLDGKPSNEAITLFVYKQSGRSIQTVSNAVKNEIKELQKTSLAGLDVFISPSTDQGVQVGKQLGSLTETGGITVLLVILVLFFTIGWRESIVAALSIPLSFLIAFIGLYFTGNTLNFISLFALILAVGILVDSGIVVTEAIHARMKVHGGNALMAAKAALKDYSWPLIAGTMATVGVFVPLLFLSGILGKFVAGIPYTLIFVLLASILVALGIVPLIAILFKKEKPNRLEEKQEEYTEKVTKWYTKKLRIFLKNSKYQKIFLWGLVGFFIISLALPIAGLVPVSFFPQNNQDFVYINIQKPEGTIITKTDLAVRAVEEILYTDVNISSFQTTVGQSSSLTGSGSSGGNQANITVNLPEGHKKTSTEVSNELREKLAVITDADIQILQASNGPSSGAPIQIQFKGENINELITAADKGRQLLASISHVTNITSSTQSNGTEFNLSIDRAKATTLGLSTQLVGQTLRAAINGTKATSITQTNQNIDVVVKLNLNTNYTDPSNTAYTTIDSIKNLSIQGASGSVLLGSVLKDSLNISNTTISHKDKSLIETVSAYPDDQTSTAKVVSEFKKRAEELNLPASVIVSYGGESESISSSFTEMLVALIAGLILMFLVLVISFNSIRYTLYLLLIVPLSLIGVLFGLAFTGQSLSFTSLLGVIGLGGIIINHAIILMDSLINDLNTYPNRDITDIVVESSEKRFRPIVLTTIATVIGMIPLAQSNPTWGPFAFTIMFGLAFALCLTLLLVPVLFHRFNNRKLISKVHTG
jgi:multidrug efflux pump subunit AcrB